MTDLRRWMVRAAFAAAILVAGAAALFVWQAHRGPPPPEPLGVIAPDDGGAILHVACVVNSARRSPLRNAALVAAIINALPPRVHVTVLTNDRDAFRVASDPVPGRVDFLDLPQDLSFTIWPQDPFLVVAGGKGPLLAASAEFQRLDDRVIGEQLARRLGWSCRTADAAFEGGNMVAGSRHLFVGAATIGLNAVRRRISAVEAVRRLQVELGRPVVVLGPMPQPVGHIDMMITALDPHRVALADARWGARIAKDELQANPPSVAAFEALCEAQCFGHPAIAELRGPDGEVVRPPRIVGQTGAAVAKSEAIADDLDRLAEELEKFGYRVERLPFLQGIGTDPDEAAPQPTSPDVPSAKQPKRPEVAYPVVTYNNVLTEALPEGRVVYLPQYGWEAMDRAGREAWQKLGYRVVPVGNFAVSAFHGGSLRCCVKVLRREDAPVAGPSQPGPK